MSDEVKSTKTEKPAPAEVEEETTGATDKNEEEGGWKEFIWNSETKHFLGRSGKSWWDIFVFYIMFFISLSLFFFLSWYISLMFVEIHVPYKNGEGAILHDKSPGLTFRPIPDRDTNGISTLIWFTSSKKSYSFWADQLKEWFKAIPAKGAPKVVDTCDGKQKESCVVDPSIYGDCDGIKDPDFGYKTGEPCILLKINRIYGWTPKLEATLPKKYQTDKVKGDNYITVPDALLAHNAIAAGAEKIPIWCEGEFSHDQENLGSIEYFPGPYIDATYFPFKNQENYQSPFLMIKLKRPMVGTMISIVCKAFAKNIHQSREWSIGYTRFQVMVGE